MAGNLSYKNRSERKKEETRNKIIDTAMRLVHQQGFDLTTMEQIAVEADIAKRTLYNHFSVKEAIVDEFVRRSLKEQEPELMRLVNELPDTRIRLISVLEQAVKWVQSHQEIAHIYIGYKLQSTIHQQIPNTGSGMNKVLAEIVRMGQEQCALRRDISTDILAAHADLIRLSIIVGCLSNPEKFPVEEAIKVNVDLFLNGAKT